uniref:Secreted protein n=1 Tax=Arundo donax TaxID=35708 RepID=A0A0A9FWD7_ARUDO
MQQLLACMLTMFPLVIYLVETHGIQANGQVALSETRCCRRTPNDCSRCGSLALFNWQLTCTTHQREKRKI